MLDADPIITEIPGTRDLYNIVWPNRQHSLQEIYHKARQKSTQTHSKIDNIFSLKSWTCFLKIHYKDGNVACKLHQFRPCNEDDLRELLSLKISHVEYSYKDDFLKAKFGSGVYGNLKYGKCDTVHVFESNV